jgi:very-short-patch-repair endonuclease
MGHPSFIDYRRRLKSSARALRRDPTPAERKLWFEFLRDLPQRFTRQKPLGSYIADFYCASRLLVIEIRWR